MTEDSSEENEMEKLQSEIDPNNATSDMQVSTSIERSKNDDMQNVRRAKRPSSKVGRDKGLVPQQLRTSDDQTKQIETVCETSSANYPIKAEATAKDYIDEEYAALNPKQVTEVRKIIEEETLNNSNKKSLLPQDTYSFMASGSICRRSFLFGTIISFIQIISWTFFLTDQVDRSNTGNPLSVPVDVSPSVRVVGFCAVFLAVISQNDIISSLDVLYFGYDTNAMKDLFGPTHCAISKWATANFLRFAQGCLGLTAVFTIIVRSSTVVDMLLSFAATEFVTFIDDVAFLLAKWGYFGKFMQQDAQNIANASYTRTGTVIFAKKFPRAVVMFSIMAVAVAFWTMIVIKQDTGRYQCQTLLVQFSDSVRPALGTFSGMYNINSNRKLGGRVTYDYARGINHGKAFFGYCASKQVWAFTYNSDPNVYPDICEDWKAHSEPTSSFDILESAKTEWIAKNVNGLAIPIDRLRMICYDCDGSYSGSNNDCGGVTHGYCVDGRCTCKKNWYGLRCQFPQPCERLEAGLDSSLNVGSHQVGNDYHIVTAENVKNNPVFDIVRDSETIPALDANVYGSPVYLSFQNISGGPRPHSVLLFTGRRWIITLVSLMYEPLSQNISNGQDFIRYINDEFHGHWTTYESIFISTPRDFDTASEGATPVGLDFVTTQPKAAWQESNIQPPLPNSPSVGNFMCAICNDFDNPCFFNFLGSKCVNGTCVCQSLKSSGTLCQIATNKDLPCDDRVNPCGLGGLCLDDGRCQCVNGKISDSLCSDFCDNDENPCKFNGTCLIDGSCNCTNKTTTTTDESSSTTTFISNNFCLELGVCDDINNPCEHGGKCLNDGVCACNKKDGVSYELCRDVGN